MNWYFFGHHRCGTSWVRDVLYRTGLIVGADYFVQGGTTGGRDSTNRAENPHRTICFVNAVPADLGKLPDAARGFHLVRDPRDVLVSDYYSRRYSHKIGNEHQRRLREQLEGMSREQGLVHMLAHATYFKQILDWPLNSDMRVLEVKYEDLLADQHAGFRKIRDHLRMPLDDTQLDEVVSACSFVRQTGRKPGEERRDAHRRKACPGDWRNYFGEPGPLRDHVYGHLSGLIQRLGYEL